MDEQLYPSGNFLSRLFKTLFPAPFQFTLVVAFSLVAGLSIGVEAWLISKTISNYLITSMTERVSRDMGLAQAFYSDHLKWIEDTARRLATETTIHDLYKEGTNQNQPSNQLVEAINRQVEGLAEYGNHTVIVIDRQGKILFGYRLNSQGTSLIESHPGYRFSHPLISAVFQGKKIISGTEILPSDVLDGIGLGEQARIPLIETPKAAPLPFDPREGSAGLVLISTAPVVQDQELRGGVIVFHLLNRDFTLVDRIKTVAGVDTATIFLGDQRISTNVIDEEGERAIGTRLSEEVGKIVLYQGRSFVGSTFVVNQSYITRYDPIFNHQGKIVGILYVGANQARFQRLENAFNRQVLFIALISILVTFLLAIPVSEYITRPLGELRKLVHTSRKVSDGDLSARAPINVGGEVGLVARSFNSMLDTLQTTQSKLIQSEKLASLGQLAAGVGHELNNPLSTIMLYTDLLRRQAELNEQQKQDLELIFEAALQCKQIISALLNFARQTKVDAQPVSLNDIITEVVEVEKTQPRYQGIEFQLELDEQLPIAELDANQIRGVVLNLIYNAAEAMPSGGKITIRTMHQPPDMILFQIQDEGEGIPPENLKDLFTPFFTTKSGKRGAGLGLAIIYGIVRMHGGHITVKSNLKEGTIFTVSLPITYEASKEDPFGEGWIGG